MTSPSSLSKRGEWLAHLPQGDDQPGDQSKPVARRLSTAERAEGEPVEAEPLSRREREILRLIALGKTNEAIAEQLVIAPGTVKKHLDNIYGKLGVHNRATAVIHAQARELL